MNKVIDLNSQEIKELLKEKCFIEIIKILFNFKDNSTKNTSTINIVQTKCNKYRITKNEFINYCKSINQWDFFDKLPWGEHDF